MSIWCEIVRYRGYMEAIFDRDTTKNQLAQKNSLKGLENDDQKITATPF
jgi:hypothetical protein